MRFASLGSGSKGNATLVEAGDTRVLVDCGFSCIETERRLARLALEPGDLSAILVTHEHSDHISGVARLSRRYHLPVWMTAGTEAVHKGGEVHTWHCFTGHRGFAIGDLQVEPFPVPHDAREPCQFVFSDGRSRLGLLTDVGSITAHIVQALLGLDAIILECNHDPDMLANGPYPPSLRQRVGGPFGHLSNQQAADLLARIDTDRLQHLVVAHLSEKNNRPELACTLLSDVLGCEAGEILVANQPDGMSWLRLDQA
ncbi:MAG TPA: MBL fold metallo-hydrolase [Gammaproteobacteria bacterium]|nr:MBL fold metallo-hydrolase [Gammaproteobacteria bacterium]